ncbi:unnamed protein product [Cyclocybe aegerita]|uniref:Rad1-domain-containing protein n=1 Tax=Cyclocybe aegerita TaxID=1973307 RepID=A0A8S0WCX2_CYCAE|nr:unnamed protein product [Cyclocybe aegerita]
MLHLLIVAANYAPQYSALLTILVQWACDRSCEEAMTSQPNVGVALAQPRNASRPITAMSRDHHMQQDEALPPYFLRVAPVLFHRRYLSFSNRATILVTENGLIVSVEDARTLVGTAYIFKDIFEEYAFHPEPPVAPQPRVQPARANKSKPRSQKKKKGKGKAKANNQSASETESETESSSEEDDQLMDSDWKEGAEDGEGRKQTREDDDAPPSTAFEIPLNTVLECLNIFGTVGASATNVSSGGGSGGREGGAGRGQGRGWRRDHNHDDNNDSDAERGGRREGRGIEAYFTGAGSEKKTGMRLSYAGSGYPLTMIIAEDASGPTTTCEVTTFEPEPQFELDFDSSSTMLKIILKSSWLRDALSELDPSCEKLTFIGNPPTTPEPQNAAAENSRQKQPQRRVPPPRPMLRIQATGTFGSTEMDYPNDREVLETFECVQTVSFSYRFAHISRTLRALQSSTKTSLRIDENGLLSLQFLMPTPRPRNIGGTTDAFVELRCSALEEDF